MKYTLFYFSLFKKSNHYTQSGAQIHDPGIKNQMLYQLSQTGTPEIYIILKLRLIDYLTNINMNKSHKKQLVKIAILFYFNSYFKKHLKPKHECIGYVNTKYT